MLAIARMSETGEIFWCSHNWPYITGFSFLETIGNKVQKLLPAYRMETHGTEQRITLLNRDLYLHTFSLGDSHVLIVEDRSVEGNEWKAAEQPVLFQELPSPQMQSVVRNTKRAAGTDATILLLGESGVGKEGIARLIHQMSPRSNKPFVKLNCGAIPESLIESELFGYAPGAYTGADRNGRKGIFEEADGGTVFLDEIGELPLSSQVKLLHVLQDRCFKRVGDTRTIKIDVRIIAATNRDLEKEVALGRFRKDLYYRLCVLPVEIPPLRQRVEDIEPLISFFLQKLHAKYNITRTVSRDALKALMHYPWPGNIRELENVLERLVLTTENTEITVFDLPASMREKIYPAAALAVEGGQSKYAETSSKPIIIQQIISLKEATTLVEKELLQMAKERSSSTYDIAKMLGVDQSTVSRKLKQYAI
jgi:transcriptional regulator with PAS, ATPase and Fis domain